MLIYACICAALFLAMVGVGLYEDLTGRYDKKFGPNMKSGMFWFMVVIFSTPVHLIILGTIVWSFFKKGGK